MQTKKMKVQYSTRARQSKSHYFGSGYIETPKIQMEGKWLEALGFSIGTPLIVEYEEGSIRIRTLTAEELAAKEQRETQAEISRRIAELEKMKRRAEKEAASLSMVAEPSDRYAAQQ